MVFEIINVTVRNQNFNLIIRNDNENVKNRTNQSTWMPLFTVLYDNLSDEQRASILRYKLDDANNIIPNTEFVFYTDVCDWYVEADSKYNLLNTGESEHQCICGVHIADEYFISNVNNLYIAYKIGSTCIDHWNFQKAKVMKQKKIQEKYKKKDKESTFCSYCGKKNNLKSCSCKRKSHDLIQGAFNILRGNAEYYGRFTKVSFGKYKNMLTYFELCCSKNKEIVDYTKWVLSNDDEWNGKDELILFNERINNNSDNVINNQFEEKVKQKIGNIWKKRQLKYPSRCVKCKGYLCEDEEVYMKNQDKKWLFKCIKC